MAQKLFICEGEIGEDLLQRQPLAGCIADGYTVTSVSGYSTRDNRQMCVVLMAEPETPKYRVTPAMTPKYRVTTRSRVEEVSRRKIPKHL